MDIFPTSRRTASPKIMLSFLNNIRDRSKVDFPLGISALAGTLRHNFGDKVGITMSHHLIDGGPNGIIQRLKIEKPDILGLSLGFGALEDAVRVIDFANSLPKAEKPLLVFGNVVASYNADLFLKKAPDSFVCVGLGEDALAGTIRYLMGEVDVPEIPNIAYVNQGEVARNELSRKVMAKGIVDTTLLPRVVESGGVVYLETSRGCVFSCAICDRKEFQAGGWRGRDIEDVLGDIVGASKMGVRNINFVDEDFFAGGTERVIEIANRIIKLKNEGGIPKSLIFGTSASVRHIYNQKDPPEKNEWRLTAFQRLHDAGLRVLFIGVESGAPAQLARYGKAAEIKENAMAVKLIEDMGVYVVPGFIMMDPLVSKEELKTNIDFLRQTGMDERITYPLKLYIPLRGSEYTNKLMALGLVDGSSYIPDRLAYEYKFKNKNIASILTAIKEWEESQAMLFWELKIIFRSAEYGRLPENEQLLIRDFINRQTRILLDYLDALVNLSESELQNKEITGSISRIFGKRLVNDMIEILRAKEEGKITSGGDELVSIIYKGLLREVIRLNFVQRGFSADEIFDVIEEQYGFTVDRNRAANTLSSFVEEGRIELNKDRNDYSIVEGFWVYRNIPWPDLPRPAIEAPFENH